MIMISMRPFAFAVLLLGVATVGMCDIQIRDVIHKAALAFAISSGTILDTSNLAGGLCFARKDEGQGPDKCRDQPAGPTLVLETARIAQWPLTSSLFHLLKRKLAISCNRAAEPNM